MIEQELATIGRASIPIHYAGHGGQQDNTLFFTSEWGKAIAVEKNTLYLVYESSLDPNCNVEVVFFFDSCWSHVASRKMIKSGRIVEVLAATSAKYPLANAPTTRPFFTLKLWNELTTRKKQGHKAIELAAAMDALIEKKSLKTTPSHNLLLGVNSLRLAVPDSQSSQVTPPVEAPDYHAVFSVHVAQSLRRNHSPEFSHSCILCRAIYVYEGSSMISIFKSACYFFSKMDGINSVTDLYSNTPKYRIADSWHLRGSYCIEDWAPGECASAGQSLKESLMRKVCSSTLDSFHMG
jgi:hypothetical protein